MSSALANIPKLRAVDARIAPQVGKIAILRGPTELTKRVITASGAVNSTSNANFTINVPQGARMSRRVDVRFTGLRVKCSVAANGGNAGRLFTQGYDSLQSYVVNRLISSVSVKINNSSVSSSNHDILDAWIKTRPQHTSNKVNSGTTTRVDNVQTYDADIVNLGALNPLGVGDSYYKGRGAFGHRDMVALDAPPNDYLNSFNPDLTDGNAHTGQLLFDVVEPLYSPALWTGEDDDVGYYDYIQKVEVNINWIANPERYIFSHAPNPNIVGAFTVDEVSWDKVELLVSFATPPLGLPMADGGFQNMAVYPYYDVSNFTTNITGPKTVSGTDEIVNSNTISLRGLPHAVLMYIKEDDNNQNFSKPQDRYAEIRKISLTLGNRTGILASAEPEQLYELSVMNGICDATYSDWLAKEFGLSYNQASLALEQQYGAGSVLLLKFTDLSPTAELAPGVAGKYDFQAQITYRVRGQTFQNPKLNLIFFYDGVLINQADYTTSLYSPLFTSADVLESGALTYTDEIRFERDMAGGSILGKMSSFIRRVKAPARQVAGLIKKGLNVASKVLPADTPIGQKVGQLSRGAEMAGQLLGFGGAQLGGAQLGGAVVGGKKGRPRKAGRPKKSQKDLMKLLMD